MVKQEGVHEIGLRIRACRKSAGLTQAALAEQTGINKSTVNRYEAGLIESPKLPVICAFARVLGVGDDYLLGKTEKRTRPALSAFDNLLPLHRRSFPLLGEIACGKPIFTDEDHESFVMAGTDLEADFCLRAKGDSMTGARILDGDVVFIRQQEEVENGQIAAVLVGDEATLKRVFYYREKNKLVLNAENPRYEPLVFVGDELSTVRILGLAVAFQSSVI